MSFEINAATLLVAALIYITSVFLKPLILVWRDLGIWWWVKKYLLNERKRTIFKRYATEKALRTTRDYGGPADFSKDVGSGQYVVSDWTRAEMQESNHADIQLSEEEMSRLIKNNSEKIALRDALEIEVNKASNLYDLLIKHYSQESRPNPIEIASAPREISSNQAREIVVSEAMKNPSKWLEARRYNRITTASQSQSDNWNFADWAHGLSDET